VEILLFPLDFNSKDLSFWFLLSHRLDLVILVTRVRHICTSSDLSFVFSMLPLCFFFSFALHLSLTYTTLLPFLIFLILHNPSCGHCWLSPCLSVFQSMNNWGVLSLVSRWWDGCYRSICALSQHTDIEWHLSLLRSKGALLKPRRQWGEIGREHPEKHL